VIGLAGFLLQGQGNDVQDAQVPRAQGCAGAAQIAEAALGHGVLVWKQSVVRGQAELPGTAACVTDDGSTQTSGIARQYRSGEENPRVRAVARA
jgi:hypothetical protein